MHGITALLYEFRFDSDKITDKNTDTALQSQLKWIQIWK